MDSITPAEYRKRAARKAPSHVAGEMNKTERAYLERRILPLVAARLIDTWVFEPHKFQLGYRCTYTPDFQVVWCDGSTEYVETKGGYTRGDSWIKFKWAAEVNPGYIWLWAKAIYKRGKVVDWKLWQYPRDWREKA